MNCRSRHADDEPEINLSPLIDVLLVILIFLAATTSFTRFNQMKLALPEAQSDALVTNALSMAVSKEGIYALNGQLLPGNTVQTVANALTSAHNGQNHVVQFIYTTPQSRHASVLRIMKAPTLTG